MASTSTTAIPQYLCTLHSAHKAKERMDSAVDLRIAEWEAGLFKEKANEISKTASGCERKS